MPISTHQSPVTHSVSTIRSPRPGFRTTLRRFLAVSVSALMIGTSGVARAQDFATGTLLNDTEIDATLMAYAGPLLKASGMSPENVTIHMVVDDNINAAATQGQTMFYNTGLLLRAQNSNEVIGVMAHEIGHIAAGHVVTMAGDFASANAVSLLSMLLAVAAGVASGNPDVGMAVMMGGQRAALGEALSFVRSQEARADQFALNALNQTGQSAQGLYNFFNRLAGEERLITTNRDPYVRTHPLNIDRMSSIKAHLDASPYTNKPLDPELERQHRRMVAKLFAFLKPQITVLQRYPESDTSIEGRYARAIAYYRRGQFDKALPIVDSLLADTPKDPFFWQIKGDMQLSRSKVDDAVHAYREAIKILPDAPEILAAMAHAMVESSNPEYFAEAQTALNHAVVIDPNNVTAWDLLARSYSQAGEQGMSAYAAAERAILMGQFGEVVRYTMQAEKLLPPATPTWYRVQDIKVTAQNYLREMRDKRR